LICLTKSLDNGFLVETNCSSDPDTIETFSGHLQMLFRFFWMVGCTRDIQMFGKKYNKTFVNAPEKGSKSSESMG